MGILVDHSDVVGASPVGFAPTTSSFLTKHLASMDWAKTTTRRGGKHFSFRIWCVRYKRFNDNYTASSETEMAYICICIMFVTGCTGSCRNGTIIATKFCRHFDGNTGSYWNRNFHYTLQWRHNESDGVSNHRRLDCLLNRLFRRRSKKTSKPRVTGPLWGESTGDRWIPLAKGQYPR